MNIFLGKPTRPGGPLEVTDVTKNGCKLKWKKPEDDGGAPVEYYEIEKLDPLTGQWLPCGKSSEPEANITGLQEGKQYKFRVRAVNKEGESDDLEADKFIVAKNPFGTVIIIICIQIHFYIMLFNVFRRTKQTWKAKSNKLG